jgi:hypothetical protein
MARPRGLARRPPKAQPVRMFCSCERPFWIDDDPDVASRCLACSKYKRPVGKRGRRGGERS